MNAFDFWEIILRKTTFSEKTYVLPTCNSTLTTKLSQRRLSKEERNATGRQKHNIRDQENSWGNIYNTTFVDNTPETFSHLMSTFNDHVLTSSILEAQIGKSPNIAQTNYLSSNCQKEFSFVGPLPSLVRLRPLIMVDVTDKTWMTDTVWYQPSELLCLCHKPIF